MNVGDNRQLNWVVHLMALARLRCAEQIKTFVAKKEQEGESKRAALHALRTHLARKVYRTVQVSHVGGPFQLPLRSFTQQLLRTSLPTPIQDYCYEGSLMPRVLRNRSIGDDVKFLQEQFNVQPLTVLPPLIPDSKFGPKTRARVKEFQLNRALLVDGVVGPVTWSSLLAHPASTTTGFCVLGQDVYDWTGTRVLLRGVNKMSVFDGDDPTGLISFPEIKHTGANTVRIVWAIASDLQAGGPATLLATLDALIANAKANHLIPMIELHDATGQWGRLGDLVTYWTQPDVVSVLNTHQAYLLVNIGNEVGNETVSRAEYIVGYTDAVQRMRAAGLHMPLVIDAPDWGKDLEMLNSTAATLLAADPEGNLVFSVHVYWSMSCGNDETVIRSRFEQAATLGYPLIVGEFSRYGGFPCGDPAASICSASAEVDYQTVLAVCHELQIGWYAWEWGPGNAFNDPLCEGMDMTPDRLFAHLKLGWALEVAISSPSGIQQTSVTPASI